MDLVLVGSDRTTSTGDVCNKIGTYLKALAARDNEVPFYVALPMSTIDWSLADGRDIPIEERSPTELTHVTGKTASGALDTVRVVPECKPGAQCGVRRDAGEIGDGPDHRAGRLSREPSRTAAACIPTKEQRHERSARRDGGPRNFANPSSSAAAS